MDVRVVIDENLCIGYGECVAEDAEAVALDDQGCAHPVVDRLPRARAERLCAACPTRAISLVAVVAGDAAA
jgi:ferredoxin